MITLMVDNYTLVKAGFTMLDLIFQVLGWSTPHQISSPRVMHRPPPKRLTTHCSVMRQVNTYHDAYPLV
jgi:hypothetical protein